MASHLWNNRKKFYWSLPPSSWQSDPKTLVISWVIGVSFVLMRQRWVGSWLAPGWRLVTRKTEPWLVAWSFRSHPPFSWERRRAGNGVNNQSCLCDEASIKLPKVWVQRASRLVNTSIYWEGDAPQLQGGRCSCAQDPPRPRPMYLLIWLFICILYHILL